MPAKLTLHPPQRATRFIVLRDGETLTVGRDPDCGLMLEDSRVSKRHARVRWTGSGWSLEDLGSKNGSSVNGAPAAGKPLADGDWVSLGGLLGRFELLTEEQALALDSERLARLATSTALRRRLGADLEPFDLLLRFLESAMQLVGAQRGFVLVAGPDGRFRAEVASGFTALHLEERGFAGSLGAVDRALQTGEAVVVCDAQLHPQLGRRPSVVGQRLGALVCVPLVHEEHVIGLLYVDSRKTGAGYTDLDLQILESLAEHAAIVLASIQLDRRIRRLAAASVGHDVLDALQLRLDALPAARA